jgi:hypothetical protein
MVEIEVLLCWFYSSRWSLLEFMLGIGVNTLGVSLDKSSL